MNEAYKTNDTSPHEKEKNTEAIEKVRLLSSLFSDIKKFNKDFGGKGFGLLISEALRAEILQKQKDGLLSTQESVAKSEEETDQIIWRFEYEKLITKNTNALKEFGLSLVKNTGVDADLFYPTGIRTAISDPVISAHALQSLSVLRGDELLTRTIHELIENIFEQITQAISGDDETLEILNNLDLLANAFGGTLHAEDPERREIEVYAKFNRIGQLKNFLAVREEANYLFERIGSGLAIADHIMRGTEPASIEREFAHALYIVERESRAGAVSFAESIKSDLLENIAVASAYLESSKMDPDKQRQHQQVLLKYTKLLINKQSLN